MEICMMQLCARYTQIKNMSEDTNKPDVNNDKECDDIINSSKEIIQLQEDVIANNLVNLDNNILYPLYIYSSINYESIMDRDEWEIKQKKDFKKKKIKCKITEEDWKRYIVDISFEILLFNYICNKQLANIETFLWNKFKLIIRLTEEDEIKLKKNLLILLIVW